MNMIDILRFWVMQMLFWSSRAVFAYPMKKRGKFRKRILVAGMLILAYCIVFWLFLWNGTTKTEYLCRCISFVFMIVFMHGCWEMKPSVAVYNSIWAISIWQILEEIWYMIEYMGRNFFEQYPFMIIVGMILLYTINDVWVALTIGKWMPVDRRDSIGPRQLGSAILIFGIIEVLSMTPALRHAAEHNFEWRFLYVCQFLAIVILYMQNELFKKGSIKQELEMMNLLWKNKQEQYELAKENIELINQKSHDLKHQIQALRKLNKEEFDAYLDDMEETIGIYESIVKTGNDVFDTILTQKSLHCKKEEFRLPVWLTEVRWIL